MPSVEEESYWEPTIREFAQTDLVQGSPVAVAGQNYAIAGGTAQLPTYLKTAVVKEAGGAGATLTVGVDYTINLRTGVLTVIGGGALAGDTQVWVSCTRTGNDDIAHRQLANRLQALKADVTALLADVAALEAITGDVVPQSRTLTAGNGLTGGGNLSANRTFTVQADGGSISVSGTGVKVGVIDDTQHGTRGGGTTHPNATTGVGGFMSPADKVKTNSAFGGATAFIASTDTGAIDNWLPGGNAAAWDAADGALCSNSGTLNINGLVAPTASGKRLKFIVNLGPGIQVLNDEVGTSTAANRIRANASFHKVTATLGCLVVVYDDTSLRWRQIGHVAGIA